MAFKVNNNIVIDDSRSLVNVQNANLAGVLTATDIKTAENGNIKVGAGGSITADALYVLNGTGEATGVATISAGGNASFTSLNISGVVTAASFKGNGSELQFLSSASITSTEAPTIRPTGEALQDGDLWFDTNAGLGGVRQYTYFDGQWIDSNAAPILTDLRVSEEAGANPIDVDLALGSIEVVGSENVTVTLSGVGSTARYTVATTPAFDATSLSAESANLSNSLTVGNFETPAIGGDGFETEIYTNLRVGGEKMEAINVAITSAFSLGGDPAFGEAPKVDINEIKTDLVGAAHTQLITALAVKTAIDSVQADVDAIEIIELERIQVAGVSTFQGQVKADGPGIGLTVANDAYIKTLDTKTLTVGNGSGTDGASAVFQATIEANYGMDVTGLSTFNSPIKADGGLGVAGVSTFTGNATFDGQATFNGTLQTTGDAILGNAPTDSIELNGRLGGNSLQPAILPLDKYGDTDLGTDAARFGAAYLKAADVSGPATFADSVTIKGDLIVENTATQINFNVKDVAVDDRLIELGTENGAAPAVATSHDLGISLNYNDGAAKRSALVWSNNAAFNLAAEISDDGADDVNITIASHAALGVGALYMGDAETAGNLAIDASKNATLANIEASGSFTLAGVALDAVESAITASSSASAIPTAAAVFAAIDTATESVGTAAQVTLQDDSAGTSEYFIPFAAAATGDQNLRTDATQLKYVPSTGTLTAQVVDTLSDINYKENIELISEPIAKVEALRGVNFDWKDGSGSSAGIIAQEVQAVMPSLITEHEDKITVNYNGLVGLLVEAVKELSAEVAQLKAAQ